VPITASNPFKWRRYLGEVLLWCVRWYLRCPISFAPMSEMAAEWGLFVDASYVWRWARMYGSEVDRRCPPHLKPTNKSYRGDETYIKVKGRDRPLCCVVNSTEQTIDFLLTDRRDAVAGTRFFCRTLCNPGNPMPRVTNVHRNPAYSVAVRDLKQEGRLKRHCRLRQCKCLNNILAKDHRDVKRRT
jgi:transposase-like protein